MTMEAAARKIKQINALYGSRICSGDLCGYVGNVMAIIKSEFPYINWAGLYWVKRHDRNFDFLVDPRLLEEPDIVLNCVNDYHLVLGPFAGLPAQQRLLQPAGVCAECLRENKLIYVPDVHEHPSHIPCDSASRSELCIPIVIGTTRNPVAVLDLDSDILVSTDRDLCSFSAQNSFGNAEIVSFFSRVAQELGHLITTMTPGLLADDARLLNGPTCSNNR